MDITQYPVAPPKIVAIATEPGLKPTYKFADPDLPGLPPEYGEDFTFGMNGIAPNGENVGSTEAELKPKMEHLLDYFAADDDSGMARRLFRKFLAKQSQGSAPSSLPRKQDSSTGAAARRIDNAMRRRNYASCDSGSPPRRCW